LDAALINSSSAGRAPCDAPHTFFALPSHISRAQMVKNDRPHRAGRDFVVRDVTFDRPDITRSSDMHASPINHPVRLAQDIPELGLHRGDPGVVFSVWMEPHAAYEVEFHPAGLSHVTRALLLENQLHFEESAPAAAAIVG
jgi:hypothetical protein